MDYKSIKENFWITNPEERVANSEEEERNIKKLRDQQLIIHYGWAPVISKQKGARLD